MNKKKLASDIKRCIAISKESCDLKIADLTDKLVNDIKKLKKNKYIFEKELSGRDAEIHEKIKSGMYTQSQLASIYGITKQRVSQIIKNGYDVVDTTEEDLNDLVYRFTVEKQHIEKKENKELIENLEKVIKLNMLVK